MKKLRAADRANAIVDLLLRRRAAVYVPVVVNSSAHQLRRIRCSPAHRAVAAWALTRQGLRVAQGRLCASDPW